MTTTPTYMTLEIRSQLACLSCCRVAAEAKRPRDGGPTTFVLVRAEDAEYVKRRRCPSCLGSLWVGTPEMVTTFHRLPPALMNPGPGRPRKSAHGPKTVPCTDCGILRTKQGKRGGPRCHPCAMALLTAQAEARDRELVAILAAADRPLSSREIADLLGSDRKRTSDRIRFARYRGAPIVTVGKAYQLAEVAS